MAPEKNTMEKRNWKSCSRIGREAGRRRRSAHTGLSQQKAVRKVFDEEDEEEGSGLGL